MALVFIKVYTTRSDGTEHGQTYNQTSLTASILVATKIIFLHYPQKAVINDLILTDRVMMTTTNFWTS